ncbi:hypothetical protein [Mesorhizobium sp. M0977]|uniref:hypothetical protein n=1 Tax=Mesorhizobium sp. M0977 TaxID=2957039 RepID=UPI00333CB3E6
MLASTVHALTLTLASAPARADDYDATIKDIQSTMGAWSSIFNGTQVDFDTFRRETGGQ